MIRIRPQSTRQLPRTATLLLIALVLAAPCRRLTAQETGPAVAPARAQLDSAIARYQSALEDSDRNRRVQAFGQSETLFSQVIDQQLAQSPSSSPTAELYLNYGNAALGAEHLGVAVAAYRRALIVAPENRRALQNLEYARSLLPDWVPRPETEISGFTSLMDSLTLSSTQLLSVALCMFFIAALLAACHLRTGWNWARAFGMIAALLWIGLLAAAWIFQSDDGKDFAVISTPEVTARSADSYNAPARLSQPLPAGTELRLLDDQGDWARVELFDGRRCWLPTHALEKL